METPNKPKNKGTRRLFENSILEALTRTNIVVPISIFFVYAGCLLWWSITQTPLDALVTTSLFSIGTIAFTWVEYNVHRYIFHIKRNRPWKIKFQYTVHGVHHEYPKDKSRLAMPPVMSITIATGLLFLFKYIIGIYAFAFISGFLVGYALYLLVHYMVHAYPPPKNFLKVLWVNHAVHHYLKEGYVFGVSSPLWDYLYGTLLPKGKKIPPVEENL